MLDLDEIEAQIDGAYDLSHLNVYVMRGLIAEIRELRAHPFRHLAFDRSSVTIDTESFEPFSPEAFDDTRAQPGACDDCGREDGCGLLAVSDPQRRNGE